MMGKFVFWVGVIALIWLGFRLFQVLKRKSQQQQQTSGSSGQERSAPGTTAPGAGPPPSADSPAPMIRCKHCGLYLPASEAFRSGASTYCSVEHRDAGASDPKDRQ